MRVCVEFFDKLFILANPSQIVYRTSKFTAAPANTFCPAAGTCDTMMLAGVGCAGGPVGAGRTAAIEGTFAAARFPASTAAGLAGGTATFTFPSLNPASCKLRLALPSGCPTKLGITNACGSAAAETRKLIFGAATCVSFAVGLCAST